MNEAIAVRHSSGGGKYLAILRVSVRQTLSQRGDLFARVIFYYAILFVFSQLWKVVLALETGLPYSRAQMLWYLAVTEWVILSLPDLHVRMEKDARTGDVAYGLPKPIYYFWSRIAEGAGSHIVRLVVIGLAGFAGATLFVGLPPDPLALWAALATGVFASAMGLMFVGLIGLSGIWLGDVTPAYWVWQKSTFVLGGLILPMEIYPQWLQTLAQWTPFHSMLYGVARWTLDFDLQGVVKTIAQQVGWLTLLIAIGCWAQARATRRLEIRGE